jgi:DNA-directed RNA polymerase alpha subunit
MEKITLIHPQGKNGVSMDKIKYETLSASFLSCLKKKKVATFDELLAELETDLKKRSQTIEGKLQWNLFWVTLDLESKKQIIKDRSTSPIKYSITKKL